MKIIINADDMGISSSIDEGIFYCIDNKLISDFSMMSNGENFDNAVKKLKDRNIRHIGCHICLVDSEKMLADDESNILGNNNIFYQSSKPYRLLFSSFLNNKIKKQCEKEINTQISKILDNNFSISHLDSHQHTHLFPMLSSIFFDCCKKYKINYLRYPVAFKKNFRSTYFSFFSNILKYRMINNKMKTIKTIGFDWDNGIDFENFKKTIEKLSNRISAVEIICHPGFIDENSKKKFSHWNFQSWDKDIKTLENIKEHLKHNNIPITNYHELSL